MDHGTDKRATTIPFLVIIIDLLYPFMQKNPIMEGKNSTQRKFNVSCMSIIIVTLTDNKKTLEMK